MICRSGCLTFAINQSAHVFRVFKCRTVTITHRCYSDIAGPVVPQSGSSNSKNISALSIALSVSKRAMATREQTFDYFLVLDFEATCLKDSKIYPQEIIEFPILKVNSRTLQVESQFHQYVHPEVYPELSPFCTELTGIIQEQVDGQPDLKTTLTMVDKWMTDENLLKPEVRSIFVTCGDWDLQTMLPSQCKYFKIEAPLYFNKWINIKKPFCEVTGTYPKGMMPMLQTLGLKHVGRHHSGIDDCRNIANIVRGLGERGHIFKATGQLES